MTVLNARNDASWQVRLKAGLEQEITTLLQEAKPNETGGLMVGLVDFKTKIVYVTRVLPAPPDSMATPGRFVRGVEGISEELARIRERTGGILDYVGEWHSHPEGGPGLSSRDERTADDLRNNLSRVPLPVHLMVATGGGLTSYVFDPG